MKTIKNRVFRGKRRLVLRSVEDYVSLIRFEASMDNRTTSEIARAADVAPATLANHLSGETTRPGFRTVVKILKAFGYFVRCEKS